MCLTKYADHLRQEVFFVRTDVHIVRMYCWLCFGQLHVEDLCVRNLVSKEHNEAHSRQQSALVVCEQLSQSLTMYCVQHSSQGNLCGRKQWHRRMGIDLPSRRPRLKQVGGGLARQSTTKCCKRMARH